MSWTGPERNEHVIVPAVVGLEMRAARKLAGEAGVTLGTADPDGPPLGALTWPGTFMVTDQRPSPGAVVHRWGTVVVDFAPWPDEDGNGDGGGDEGGAGDREPRRPGPSHGAERAALEASTEPATPSAAGPDPAVAPATADPLPD